jgi:transcriptional regulator with XRE-family HTH domain
MAEGSSANDPNMIAVAIGLEAGMAPIQAARDYRGWTRAELAAKAGTTVEVIAELEEGTEPDPDLLERLASALGVPSDLLID